MAKLTRPNWFHAILLDAVASLEKRPVSRRGPFLITDEHLRNARAALEPRDER